MNHTKHYTRPLQYHQRENGIPHLFVMPHWHPSVCNVPYVTMQHVLSDLRAQ